MSLVKKTKKFAISVCVIIAIMILPFCLMAVAFLIMITVSCLFPSYQPYIVTGIENFPAFDTFELVLFLAPDDIKNKYEFVEADFYLYEPDLVSLDPTPTSAIVYFEYTEDVYFEAKDYVLNNTDYDEEEYYSYKSYHFYENMALPKYHENIDENGKNRSGLQWFTMICYSDLKHRLVFIGLHISNEEPNEIYQEKGWGEFLKTYFSWYDFDA